MKTVGDILQRSSSFLKEKQVEHPRRTAEEILGHVLQKKRLDLYLCFDLPLEEGELNKLRPLLQRAVRGEPLQYILGEVPFYHCSIKVSRDVLIPRSETEQLVDRIVKRIEKEDLLGKSFWDLCTGSGCIGIALKKRFPLLSVALSDVSRKAMQCCSENAKRNGVDLSIYEGDLFAPFVGKTAHFIAANPPYISESEFFTLQKGVKDFEPKEALVSGPTGLEFYRRLAEEAPLFLETKGLLFLEIGASQANEVVKIFSTPKWASAQVSLDDSGRNRFIFLEKE